VAWHLPGAGSILSALQPRAELSTGVQQIQVVAANKVLGQAHNGALQAGLAVVVGGVLRNIASQLRHLSGSRKQQGLTHSHDVLLRQ